MTEILTIITSLFPIVLLLVATLIGNFSKVSYTTRLGEYTLGFSILSSIPLLLFLYLNQQLQIPSIALELLDGLLRFDALSTAMFLMVSIIGFVVLRFSESYLQGDTNHKGFIQRLLLTIGLVQVLVLSGNLFILLFAWSATSMSLRYLMLYQKERKSLHKVARKKNIIARISDVALLIAVALLYLQFNTADLETIFLKINRIQSNQIPLYLELAGVFLAVAAIVKSAQIPFHGWLLNVMEAPTPVSALLHAGLLNAGPFLIIRFSYLMNLTDSGSFLLLLVGGISALYGTIVFPTQPAIKTSLAYSSIGHMGFSLMVCGMGLYSASLLHLIAHSLYKAHSFLSSGSVIDKSRLKQLDGQVKVKIKAIYVVISFLITSALYLVMVRAFGEHYFGHFQIMILGIVIISGVSFFMTKAVMFDNGLIMVIRVMLTSGFVLFAFLTFERFMDTLLGYQIPELSNPNIMIKITSLVLLISFIGVVFFSMFKRGKPESKWKVYIRNGFYVHVVFDRLLEARVRN